ncbi:MAG: DNA recombination protein RmuC [Candidatus Nealsonbacteria bacterium]|nr:DNA recombination protein RmuC [Candidatus Nealsonbacteria bacterium]
MEGFFYILFYITIISGGVLIIVFWIKKSKTDQEQDNVLKDLERRLTDLMIGQQKEIRGSVDNTSRAMNEQISSFTRETVQIRQDLKQVQETMKGISSFQEIFKSPKLRGQWGEATLAHILSEYFPRELYESEHLFSSGEQVDFVLKLPDKKLLPIDVKFSSDNFLKMIEAKSEEERISFQKKFTQDVKFNIDKIAAKYILPSEGTVDYGLMYIPAEAIFHNMIFDLRDENIGEYARKKKIVLTSPNTIYLTLKTIEHWFRDTRISHQTQEILKRLDKIQQDSGKLMEDFRKLGGHLRNAVSTYDSSEKRLSLFSDRVDKMLEIKEEPKKLK